MLGLELTDVGFDYSLLSEFRSRLIAGEQSAHLLDELLRHLQSHGWLKGGGKQRTDSTHVLAAVRKLNRLEMVGETLRQSLEQLAPLAPDWLVAQVDESWFERYSVRVESAKLAKTKAEQSVLMLRIGQDGHQLLQAIDESDSHGWLAQSPAIALLRQIWIQQYYFKNGKLTCREAEDLPPNRELIQSPYDREARNRTKRQTNWTGYAVHLSETCEDEGPNWMTHVQTTPATVGDSQVLPKIHQALQAKQLAPKEHFLDHGYSHSQSLVEAAQNDLDLVMPVTPERPSDYFVISCFSIDWDRQQVTCPGGKSSLSWIPAMHSDGDPMIRVSFSRVDCRDCPLRADCLSHPSRARRLNILTQDAFMALEAARARQKEPSFQKTYGRRAGIEGTISQAVRAADLRRSRYIGLAKTHLQQVAIVAGINLVRLGAMLSGHTKGKTRTSHFAKLRSKVSSLNCCCC
jgi:transposase